MVENRSISLACRDLLRAETFWFYQCVAWIIKRSQAVVTQLGMTFTTITWNWNYSFVKPFLSFYFNLTGFTFCYRRHSRSPPGSLSSGILCRGERDLGCNRSFCLFCHSGHNSSSSSDEHWKQKSKQVRKSGKVGREKNVINIASRSVLYAI